MNIIAAVDFSPVTAQVLRMLQQIGARVDAQIWLIHVISPDPAFIGYQVGPDVVRSQIAAEHRERHAELQRLADELRAAGVATTALVLQGATVATINEEAEKRSAALIVLGSHGHGAVYDLMVGSVSEGVVRTSKVPVLLVPARA